MRKKKISFVLAIVIYQVLWICSFSAAELKEPGQTVLNKAMDYILKIQNPDGSWPLVEKEGGSDLEATLWATRSIFMNAKMGDSAYKQGLNGLAYIFSSQLKDGSFSNNSAHTAFAIMAIKESGQGKDAIDRAVLWLKDVQNKDGGWRKGLKGPSLSIYTGVVLSAFEMIGIPRTDPSVLRGIDWLKVAQNPDGGWGMPKGGRSLSVGTPWALVALTGYGEGPGSDCIQKGHSWLTAAQTERNGGIVIFPHPATSSDPELTAYAILAFVPIKGSEKHTDMAIEYLSDVQKPQGNFVSNTPKEFKKKRKANTQTTCFVIWALTSAGH